MTRHGRHRPRCADDRRLARGRAGRRPPHPAALPTTRPIASWCARSPASRARAAAELVCEPSCSTTVAARPRTEAHHAAPAALDATDGRPRSGCSATCAWASRATACGPATRCGGGDATPPSPGRRSWAVRPRPRRPATTSAAPRTSGARGWSRATSRTTTGAATPALRAHVKGLTYAPTGALVAALDDLGGPSSLWRAQLGLPVPGCATPRSRCGRYTPSGSTGRPTTSRSTWPTWTATMTARCRSCTGSTAGATSARARSTSLGCRGRPAGPHRQRRLQPASRTRRLRRRAGLDLPFHTKANGYIPQRLVARDLRPGECAAQEWREPDQGIWEARGEPKHYVSSKRTLGGDGPGVPPGLTAGRARAGPALGHHG